MSDIEPRSINKLRKKKKKQSEIQKKGIKSLPAAIFGAIFLTYFMFKLAYILISFEGLPPGILIFTLFEALLFTFGGVFIMGYGCDEN